MKQPNVELEKDALWYQFGQWTQFPVERSARGDETPGFVYVDPPDGMRVSLSITVPMGRADVVAKMDALFEELKEDLSK